MRYFTEKLTYTFVIGSCLMHLFCCGVPLVLAMANVGALLGFVGAGALHTEWFEQFEQYALLVSGALLVVTGLIQFISSRINCRTQGSCAHEPCDKKKDFSRQVFKFAVVLYAVNIVIFTLSH